jgi:C1A family cysteine protease
MNLVLPRNPKYGWIPDLPDQRDFSYAKLAENVSTLEGRVDLRPNCTPVENQGDLGCCTACALVGNLEFLKFQSLKKIIDFSKLFLYYNERAITHQQTSDSGASLRDGIKTLKKQGDCLETDWPYVIPQFTVEPPKQCYTDAEKFLITKYFSLHTLNEMKQTLSSGYPFVFGFAVYESFESVATTTTGIVTMPEPKERMVGGHAVCAVGYNDEKKWFIVRNSWGDKWGDHGYFYMPYAYLSNSSLSSSFWTIRDME